MVGAKFRSSCPIASALDIVGDKWSLLIIRDLAFMGKAAYGDFASSEENISTNILADRLSWLEAWGIISKNQNPTNKKKFIYKLTEKGVDLLPILLEIILWSDKYLQEHIAPEAKSFALQIRENKGDLFEVLKIKLLENA